MLLEAGATMTKVVMKTKASAPKVTEPKANEQVMVAFTVVWKPRVEKRVTTLMEKRR